MRFMYASPRVSTIPVIILTIISRPTSCIESSTWKYEKTQSKYIRALASEIEACLRKPAACSAWCFALSMIAAAPSRVGLTSCPIGSQVDPDGVGLSVGLPMRNCLALLFHSSARGASDKNKSAAAFQSGFCFRFLLRSTEYGFVLPLLDGSNEMI